jgi:hypothetical protein
MRGRRLTLEFLVKAPLTQIATDSFGKPKGRQEPPYPIAPIWKLPNARIRRSFVSPFRQLAVLDQPQVSTAQPLNCAKPLGCVAAVL